MRKVFPLFLVAVAAASCGAGRVAGVKSDAPKPTPTAIRLKWEDRENLRQLQLQAAVANNGLQAYLNTLSTKYHLPTDQNWSINFETEKLEYNGPANTSGTAKP